MGSFKLKLVLWFALLALLPLAVAFYGYDALSKRSETRRVDAGLEAGCEAPSRATRHGSTRPRCGRRQLAERPAPAARPARS